jgi:sulfate transporter 3
MYTNYIVLTNPPGSLVSLFLSLSLSMGTVMESEHLVNFAPPRGFATTLKSDLKETFFPDDPFQQFRNEKPAVCVKKALQFFVPILEWLPKYNFRLFRYDLLAGITIASLAIPQGISYAKLANLPPIIGLCKSTPCSIFHVRLYI